MAAAGLGIGIPPAIAAELYGRAVRATTVRLDEAWASRCLVIVTRSRDSLDPLEGALYDALTVWSRPATERGRAKSGPGRCRDDRP